MVAKRSARAERAQTINQARSLIVTGPDDLRIRFARRTVVALGGPRRDLAGGCLAGERIFSALPCRE
jgi:hypothetical protein